MKGAKLAAIVLIVVGVIGLVYQEISYTKREEVLRIGDFKASVETRKTIPIPRYLGIGCLAGGLASMPAGEPVLRCKSRNDFRLCQE